MDDRKAYIQEIFRIVGTDSILVIDRVGKLRRIYCPFRVIVVIPVGEYDAGMIVMVEAVKMTLELRDVFVVERKAYYLVNFEILLDEIP